MNFIKEHIYKIILNLELRELCSIVHDTFLVSSSIRWLLYKGLNALVKDIGDGLDLDLLVGAHS